MIQASEIQQLIEQALVDCIAKVASEDNIHFTAVVVAPAFTGKSRVQKQQMVYAALGNRLHDGTIHALSVKTFTPDEWQTNLKSLN